MDCLELNSLKRGYWVACRGSYLLQFVRDHGESSEDTVCGAGDGDDPLWTGALWDVDPSAALWGQQSMVQINRIA